MAKNTWRLHSEFLRLSIFWKGQEYRNVGSVIIGYVLSHN